MKMTKYVYEPRTKINLVHVCTLHYCQSRTHYTYLVMFNFSIENNPKIVKLPLYNVKASENLNRHPAHHGTLMQWNVLHSDLPINMLPHRQHTPNSHTIRNLCHQSESQLSRNKKNKQILTSTASEPHLSEIPNSFGSVFDCLFTIHSERTGAGAKGGQ